MSLICMLRGHRSGSWEQWNEGYCFSACAGCRQELVRTSGDWRTLPSGYRIGWKSGVHRHAIPSDLRRNLPLLPNEVKRWRLGLHRFGFTAIPLPAPPSTPAPEERREEAGLPSILLLAAWTFLGAAGWRSARG